MQKVPFPEADQRAQKLLSEMSLEEKIDYIGGHEHFNIRGYPSHGIPEIKMADGPLGCRNYGKATAFPSTITLASSWNEDLSSRMGEALGRECRTKGVHILLAPGVNIHRIPQCGRNFEYLGEDPALASCLAVAYIKSLQAGGVMGTVKHFIANNQEFERHKTNSEIGERALHEIYYPAFKAAVQEAEVGSVMNAYNLVNGEHCSQNKKLLVETLKEQWGFTGFVMSDWVSVYDTKAAIEGGLDLEMPFGDFISRERVMPLLNKGEITEEQINDKVLRILRTCIRMGFFDRPQMEVDLNCDDPASRETALEIARQGCVLLKNDNLLPLDIKQVKNVVITGPNAHPHVVGGGGSSLTEPFRSVSIVDALKRSTAGKINFIHMPVATRGRMEHLSKQRFFETDASNGTRVAGLTARYYFGPNLRRTPVMERIDETLDFEWNAQGPCAQLDHKQFSVKWSGFIVPEQTGQYQLAFSAKGGLRVWLDDEMLIDGWHMPGSSFHEAMPELEEGKEYRIEVALCRHGISASIRASVLLMDWTAVENADVVLACMGFNPDTEGEHRDRTFELPEDQRNFMDKLMETNSKAVLIANAGGAFDVTPWIDRIPAFLHQWYSGQAGGQAVADILTGAVNPSGKLPISFGRKLKDYPGQKDYPGRALTIRYDEGIFVGYRHFDSNGIEPLFPFGHGISYTTFDYSNLSTPSEFDVENDELEVSVDITNTGERAGAEVVQLYVAAPGNDAPRPTRELKGFARVELEAGETKTAKIKVRVDALAWFNAQSGSWEFENGEHRLLVGSSSRDIKLEMPLILNA
jgi:beta-glucosidase